MRKPLKLYRNIGLLALAGFSCGATPKAVLPKSPPPLVAAAKVTEVTHTSPREYVGTVKAIETVDLPSRISGTITGIKFREGSMVKKGDLLFTIEDTTYRAKMLTAEANLNRQASELEDAEKNYRRLKKLVGQDAVSKSNFDNAERLRDSTRAQYKAYQAELMDAKNNLDYTKIYAPISGRIGEIKHTFGNYVTPSSSYLARIVRPDPIEVEFSISERDFLNLFQGSASTEDRLSFQIHLSNGRIYHRPGKIAFVDNMVDNSTDTITVWLEFPNPDGKLVPGGYVTVNLTEKLKNPVPAIPATALLSDIRGNYVYVVDKNHAAVRREIKPGGAIGRRLLVLSGLKPGETVVSDGTHKVIPGKPVRFGASSQKEEVTHDL